MMVTDQQWWSFKELEQDIANGNGEQTSNNDCRNAELKKNHTCRWKDPDFSLIK